MEIVFEVVNRSGRVLERHRSRGTELTIGRAFDNKLILSDETVSPHHARIETTDRGAVVLRDLDSLNGIRNEQHERVTEKMPLHSGSEYSFGRARVRIYSTTHAVSDTVRIGGLDWLANRLGNAWVLASIVSLAALVAIIEQWLHTSSVVQWQQMGIGVVGVMTAAVIIAMFWAIVGRIIKHEGRFKTQLAIILLYLLLQSAIYFGYEILLFNSLHALVSTTLSVGLSFLLLCTLFWLNLHIATNQANAQRWQFAATISTILLCLSSYPEMLKRTEFSTTPEYIRVIKSPAARFTTGHDEDNFLGKLPNLFGQTNLNDDA